MGRKGEKRHGSSTSHQNLVAQLPCSYQSILPSHGSERVSQQMAFVGNIGVLTASQRALRAAIVDDVQDAIRSHHRHLRDTLVITTRLFGSSTLGIGLPTSDVDCCVCVDEQCDGVNGGMDGRNGGLDAHALLEMVTIAMRASAAFTK